jgi:hypothetical protein
VLIIVELGSVAMEGPKGGHTKRQLGTRLGSSGTLSNALFLVLEGAMIVGAKTCWIV